jgi:hypothetical protein
LEWSAVWASVSRCHAESADAAVAWLGIETSELNIVGVTAGTGSGKAVGLRISGKIFAFPKDGEPILKLPCSGFGELIESGAGRPWVPGTKVMKEWVAVSAAASEIWASLVAEARTFVGSAWASSALPRVEHEERPKKRL